MNKNNLEYDSNGKLILHVKTNNLFVNRSSSVYNNYTIKDKIGQGSWGTVYSVEEKSSNLLRAMKKLPKTYKSELYRFRHEIQLLKYLDHPNIVTCYECYEDFENIYLIMELCKGGELHSVFDDNRFLTEIEIMYIMYQILMAISYLHNKNIVHRDIKPENFLFYDLNRFRLKLVDFGLSARIRSTSHFKSSVGTIQYSSPQVLTGHYTQKCDIWSAGIIMYLLFSRELPFDDRNHSLLIKKILSDELDFSASIWSSISKNAKDLIILMLERKEEYRLSAIDALKHPWFLHLKERIPRDFFSSFENSLSKQPPSQLVQRNRDLTDSFLENKSRNISSQLKDAVVKVNNENLFSSGSNLFYGECYSFFRCDEPVLAVKENEKKSYSTNGIRFFTQRSSSSPLLNSKSHKYSKKKIHTVCNDDFFDFMVTTEDIPFLRLNHKTFVKYINTEIKKKKKGWSEILINKSKFSLCKNSHYSLYNDNQGISTEQIFKLLNLPKVASHFKRTLLWNQLIDVIVYRYKWFAERDIFFKTTLYLIVKHLVRTLILNESVGSLIKSKPADQDPYDYQFLFYKYILITDNNIGSMYTGYMNEYFFNGIFNNKINLYQFYLSKISILLDSVSDNMLLTLKFTQRCLLLFDSIDLYSDPTMTIVNISKYITNTNKRRTKKLNLAEDLSQIILDESLSMSYTNFVAPLVHSMKSIPYSYYKPVFRVFDKDEDGIITKNDLIFTLGLLDLYSHNQKLISTNNELKSETTLSQEFNNIIKGWTHESSNNICYSDFFDFLNVNLTNFNDNYF